MKGGKKGLNWGKKFFYPIDLKEGVWYSEQGKDYDFWL